MDLHHLRTFVVVAEERSFTKAAARLHISQPPLSRHIRQLEEILGAQLLVRNRQRVELTAEGHILLAKARAVIGATDEVFKAAAQLRAGAIGTVKMGLSRGMWNVAQAVRSRYATSCSRVILEVAHVGSSDQANALLARSIDVGVMRGGAVHAALTCAPLFDEQIVVMLPSTHPLANAESVKLSDLSNETIGVSQSVLYDKVFEMYSLAGVTPAGTIDCPPNMDVDAIRMLVVSGRAIYFSLESPWTTSARVAGISTVRVDEPNARLSVHVSWRTSERSASVLTLVECARKAMIQNPIPLEPTARLVSAKRPAVFSTSNRLAQNRRASGL